MNEAQVREEFERRKPALNALGDYVTTKVLNEIHRREEGNSYETPLPIPPKHRVKSTKSFLQKIITKKKVSPFEDITDQVATRFVALHLGDIPVINEIIETIDWTCQKDKDFEQEKRDKPTQFYYQSDHYVVRLRKSIEWNDTIIPLGYSCEIQVRTLLQHAFSEMDHDTIYKPSVCLDDEEARVIRRKFAKGSALIETTDDVFLEIKEAMAKRDAHNRALLQQAELQYSLLFPNAPARAGDIGTLISDPYRSQLSSLTAGSLKQWASQKSNLLQNLFAKGSESIVFQDPGVMLIAWLVEEHPLEIRDNWPIDQIYLEQIYSSMGRNPAVFLP